MGVVEDVKNILRKQDCVDDNISACDVDGFCANLELEWSVFPMSRQWWEAMIHLQPGLLEVGKL